MAKRATGSEVRRRTRGSGRHPRLAPPAVAVALRQATEELTQLGISYAIVGGLAVSVRTEPRFTRDADVAVATASDEDAERIVHRMMGAGYAVLASIEQTKMGRLATVRLRAPNRVVVDLLFASAGIENEIVAAAQPMPVTPGGHQPVARIGHLIAMKVLSRSARRFQDDADLFKLLEAAGPADLDLAREALSLISKRGYARNKNLSRDWQGVLRRFRATTDD